MFVAREVTAESLCSFLDRANGADAYHDSHVHLDLLERSNHYKICQWDVLDLTETAALAAKKAAATTSSPAVVKVSEIPLPRPRPVLLSDRPRNRSVRLGEAGRHPRAAESESHQGYSPFEGIELSGRVKNTFLRGVLIYADGKIVGPPRGEYLRRPQSLPAVQTSAVQGIIS
jgi:hypothetical protein